MDSRRDPRSNRKIISSLVCSRAFPQPPWLVVLSPPIQAWSFVDQDQPCDVGSLHDWDAGAVFAMIPTKNHFVLLLRTPVCLTFHSVTCPAVIGGVATANRPGPALVTRRPFSDTIPQTSTLVKRQNVDSDSVTSHDDCPAALPAVMVCPWLVRQSPVPS